MNIFSADVITQLFQDHYFLFLTGILVGTFACTWYLIPKVIWVTREKKLMKPVIDRSVHTQPVPTLGGIAFFITLILVVSLIQALKLENVGNHLVAAVTILFMVGLKDDLVVSTPRVKLFGQLIAIAFLIFAPDLHITNLNGFLGIEEIPLWLGFGIAGFVLLAIINSYNLIDGIDGLAAVTGMVIGSIYAGIFYFTQQHFYVLLSLSLVGMLAGYLRFNYSKGSNKIFMGDSGALTIGLFIGFLTLKVFSFEAADIRGAGFPLENTILVLLGVLFIPFLDTTRAIVIRLMNGKSPFNPDRNHIHHVLLDAGLNHLKATIVLSTLNLIVFVGIYSLAGQIDSVALSVAVVAIIAACCGLFHAIKRSSSTIITEGSEEDNTEDAELPTPREAVFSTYGSFKVSRNNLETRRDRHLKKEKEDVAV